MAQWKLGSTAVAGVFPPEENRRLYFKGSAGSLLGIQLVNMLLILCTLGVYLFWAKVRVRRYLLGATEFEGDRFAYHGTGRELLIGSLKAGLVFVLPFMVLTNVPAFLQASAWVKVTCAIVAYVILSLFIPFAIVGTRRYRMSRTSWRGIRFSFRGRASTFFGIYFKGFLLTAVTLGLYTPFFEVKRYAFLTSNSYFGNRKFDFDGTGRDLFRPFIIAALLTLPTLGIYAFWYQAKKMRYLAERTAFEGARFSSTATGGGLLGLQLTNLLLVLLTLGIGLPWAIIRSFRYWYDHISLRGPLDLAAIEQEPQAASATAEGLAGFLDLDFGFGF
jgi:uncharacterized membrane protein YjgN (DUF898 family)